LVRLITQKVQCQWSPEQIAGWLKRRYPADERYHVSHETIYKSLFIQARGVLQKELLACLRTQRAMRRSKHASLEGQGRGKIVDAVSTAIASSNPACAAIPSVTSVSSRLNCPGELALTRFGGLHQLRTKAPIGDR
jgi:hypothetical protein